MLRTRRGRVVIEADARCAHRTLEARLRPFVARRVSDAAAVDDVVQDVFLRMQRGLAGLRDNDRFGAWLYKVARSAIADRQRADARQPMLLESLPEPAVSPEEPEGELACELASYVTAFIRMLPSPYREALTLTELEGFSQREAAEMSGVSLSGMKSRVQRGRGRLRALIDECCQIALDARGRVVACAPRPGALRAHRDCC